MMVKGKFTIAVGGNEVSTGPGSTLTLRAEPTRCPSCGHTMRDPRKPPRCFKCYGGVAWVRNQELRTERFASSRMAACHSCGARVRYDGRDGFGLDDFGRQIWDRKGPPVCCGSRMVEVVMVQHEDRR